MVKKLFNVETIFSKIQFSEFSLIILNTLKIKKIKKNQN